MPDIFNFNNEMKDYFNSLPSNIQDRIKSSNVKISSKADLEQIVQNTLDNKKDVSFEQKI